MSLVLTEEQELVGSSVRRILEDAGAVAHLRRLRDQEESAGHSPTVWRAFCEGGFGSILVPEGSGGAGLGPAEVAAIMQELGRALVPIPFLSTSVLSVTALNLGASPEQKAFLFPRINAGDLVIALAVDEGPKHRPDTISLAATAGEGGFVLNGAKTFVIDGQAADHFIVAARSDSSGTSEAIDLFLVPSAAPGVSIQPVPQIDSHMSANVTFRSCRLEQSMRLAHPGGGRKLLDEVLRQGRIAVAAELLGLADECVARTVAYLKTRRQFGQPIGAFQALQHRAARLFVEVEMSRAAVLAAVDACRERSPRLDLLISVAKARAGATATLAVQESVQLHGGMGMTDEMDIGFFMKRARVLQETLGDTHYHLNRIAELGGY
jgi:alkylation response protein AidB-like acyl-CoA dehydrogenase